MRFKHWACLFAAVALLLVGGAYFLIRSWPTSSPDEPSLPGAPTTWTGAPPVLLVAATYPGANAQVVADTVAAPSSSRSWASRARATCRLDAPMRAPTRSPSPSGPASISKPRGPWSRTASTLPADPARRGQAGRSDGPAGAAPRPPARRPLLAGGALRQPLSEQLRHHQLARRTRPGARRRRRCLPRGVGLHPAHPAKPGEA